MDLRLFVALFIAISVTTYYTNKSKKEYEKKKKLEEMKPNITLQEPTVKIEKVKKKPIPKEEPEKEEKKTKKKND